MTNQMGCCCQKKSSSVHDPNNDGAPLAPPATIGRSSGASSRGKAVTKDVLDKKVEQAAKTHVLALRECGLKRVPQEAIRAGGPLAALRTADVSGNALTSIPSEVGSWPDLQTLNAAGNALTQVADTLFTALPQLQKLMLSANRLATLPNSLGSSGLEELMCDGNRLSSLPDVFGGRISGTLRELDVSANSLRELPASLCELRALARLMVQKNQLVALPLKCGGPAGEGLSKLEHVDAADNSICLITPETLRLSSLSELWLRGNPIDRLELQKTEGFEGFAERRKQRLDKKIDQKTVVGTTDLSMCGL